MFLPLVFKSAGMRCLIVGGGEVAVRKMELLLTAGCVQTIIAPQIHDRIRAAVEKQAVAWRARKFQKGDCQGFQLVIAATGHREVNKTISEEAAALCVPVNVVDDPALCTVIFPAVWQRSPLTISVSTGGDAPFMAAAVRDRLAGQGEALARWVEFAAVFRTIVRFEIVDWREKNRLYRLFIDAIQPGDPPDPPESKILGDWVAWLEKLRGQGK
jgi:uroporphyrin-III C-methyltransferase / precorrin-2 dehydrogenase / sirohydrochlorin ferrochelatase